MRHERDITAAPSKDVFRRLTEVRLAWKLPLEDVAPRIGTTPANLRKWELGLSVPSTKSLMRWASVLGFDISIWPKENAR